MWFDQFHCHSSFISDQKISIKHWVLSDVSNGLINFSTETSEKIRDQSSVELVKTINNKLLMTTRNVLPKLDYKCTQNDNGKWQNNKAKYIILGGPKVVMTKNYSHFSSYYLFLQYFVFICNPVSAMSCYYLIYDSFLIYSTGQKFSDILLTIDKIYRYFSLLSVC